MAYDPERDDCTHGYPNGLNCPDCDKYSLRVEMVILAILAIIATVLIYLNYFD